MDRSLAMEAAATAGLDNSSDGGDRWSSSTNWIVSGGLLRDSVSFETSYDEEGDDGPSSWASKPCTLMMSPPSVDGDQDPLPCEVTVCFKGKYELHRVYVKSTARTYEIYYADNHLSNNKEYLCTVRCGASGEEVASSRFFEGATAEFQNVDSKAAYMQIIKPHLDSTSSNEDGWIEVQIPDHSVEICKGKTLPSLADVCASSNSQVYYEATAEISDASPCFSITLRFLSLQMKTCVHIAEIYVYADPVDCSSPDNSTDTMHSFGGNSLLAMFTPNILQLSKLGTSRLEEKVSLNSFGLQKHLYDLPKADQPGSLDRGRTSIRDVHSGKEDIISELQHGSFKSKQEDMNLSSAQSAAVQEHSNMGPQHVDLAKEQAEVKSEVMQLGSDPIIADQGAYCNMTDQKLNHVQGQNVEPEVLQSKYTQACYGQVSQCNHEEKHMSDSRIDKMLGELLSRVGRIEEFCSRFEENMMKPLGCIETRLERLEQLFNVFPAGYQCRTQPSSRISAPEFSCDESDLENDGRSNSSTALNEETTNISLPSPVNFTAVIESKMCPGLVVKAPEFSNENEECVQTADGSGFGSNACGEDKVRPSIDSALASALAAFMMEKPIADGMGLSELSSEYKNDSVLNNKMDAFSRKPDLANDIQDTALLVSADNSSAFSVDMPTEMSERHNFDYNIQDKVAKSTGFVNSLDVSMDHSSSISPTPTNPCVEKPEISNDDYSINCGKDPESNNKGLHDNQKGLTFTCSESNPTSTSSHLVEFEVMPRSETSMPSIVGNPVEESGDPYSENDDKIEKVITDCKELSTKTQTQDDNQELHEYSSPSITTQDDHMQPNLTCLAGAETSNIANKKLSDGDKESIPENSSFLCDKDHVGWSNLNGACSLAGPFSGDGYNEQGADDYGSTKAAVESSLHQDYSTVDHDSGSAGHIQKPEPILDFRPRYDEPILDVKFTREENWLSELSLDILLCETYVSDGKDYASEIEEHVSKDSQLNQGTIPVNEPLVEVENPSSVDVVSHFCHDEVVQSPQDGEQPFPSLI